MRQWTGRSTARLTRKEADIPKGILRALDSTVLVAWRLLIWKRAFAEPVSRSRLDPIEHHAWIVPPRLPVSSSNNVSCNRTIERVIERQGQRTREGRGSRLFKKLLADRWEGEGEYTQRRGGGCSHSFFNGPRKAPRLALIVSFFWTIESLRGDNSEGGEAPFRDSNGCVANSSDFGRLNLRGDARYPFPWFRSTVPSRGSLRSLVKRTSRY